MFGAVGPWCVVDDNRSSRRTSCRALASAKDGGRWREKDIDDVRHPLLQFQLGQAADAFPGEGIRVEVLVCSLEVSGQALNRVSAKTIFHGRRHAPCLPVLAEEG